MQQHRIIGLAYKCIFFSKIRARQRAAREKHTYKSARVKLLTKMPEYIEHKLIVPNSVEARTYQVALAESALHASSMIVLPTGLGKTIVALLVIAQRLESGGRIVFLAPTKPLVEQHAEFLRSHLLAETTIFTGEIPADKRSQLWGKPLQAVVSTPQVIENDLKAHRINLSDVRLIVFDEAHRAVGNYAYRFIAAEYLEQADDPLILGMTASPGSTVEKIHEVSESLFIDNVQIRTESDPDVFPYTHQRNTEIRRLVLPSEMEAIRQRLKQATKDRLRQLMKMRVIFTEWTSTSELIRLQSKVAADKNYQAMSLLAEVIKLRHAIGLVETQGVVPARKYFERLIREARSKKGSKAARRLVADERVKAAISLSEKLNEIHPKLAALKHIVAEEFAHKPDARIIVFTNYRDTAEVVRNALSEVRGIRAERFVGQAKKNGSKGLSQKEQIQLISSFVDGTYNVLVATSVAEEGLDIPSTDMVVFYEPIPSEIRSIQREGRTGRRRSGRIVVLITKDTRDETYSLSSIRKKRMMREEMKRLSANGTSQPQLLSSADATSDDEMEVTERQFDRKAQVHPEDARIETQCSFHAPEEGSSKIGIQHQTHNSSRPLNATSEENQRTLLDFEEYEGKGEKRVRVLADRREARSGILEELEALGATVEIRTLPVADYVISDRVAIERKTVRDFVSSIIERELPLQIQRLVNNYARPLLLLEGSDLATERNISSTAVRAMLASIAIDWGVPVLCSRDAFETAKLLLAVAEREQSTHRTAPSVHGKKIPRTLEEQQEYVISAIPSIGPVNARALLQHFGSVEAVFSASAYELTKVYGIGKQTAEKIRKLAAAEYKTL